MDGGVTFPRMEEKICQVCGTPLGVDDDVVECERCSTLHHRECWDYLGRCSTFGCEGRTSDEASAGAADNLPTLYIDAEPTPPTAPTTDQRHRPAPLAKCRPLAHPGPRTDDRIVVALLLLWLIPFLCVFFAGPKQHVGALLGLALGGITTLMFALSWFDSSMVFDPRARSVQAVERRPWGTYRTDVARLEQVASVAVERWSQRWRGASLLDRVRFIGSFVVVLRGADGEILARLGCPTIARANATAADFGRLTGTEPTRMVKDHQTKRRRRKKRTKRRRKR